jgi:osmoprotectant transport system substrate-binding protein
MSAITTEGFVALEDDKTIVANEAVLPLLRSEVATPEVIAVLDQVNAELTTDILKALMVKIEVDKKAPDEVAKEFIASVAS